LLVVIYNYGINWTDLNVYVVDWLTGILTVWNDQNLVTCYLYVYNQSYCITLITQSLSTDNYTTSEIE